MTDQKHKIIDSISHLGFIQTLSTDNHWGSIMLVTHPNHSDKWVSKCVSIGRLKRTYSQEDCLRREIEMLSICNHPNIIKMLGVHEDLAKSKLYLFLPFANLGDLGSFIDFNHPLQPDQIKSLFGDIVKGIEYLHTKLICHRDIKPSNILVFGDRASPTAKLCDFGFASNETGKHRVNTRVGTPLYSSYNLLTGNVSNPYKNDIWSLGVTLWHITFGRAPFDPEDGKLQTLIDLIALGIPLFPEKKGDLLEMLLIKLLEPTEASRPSIEEIAESEYLNSI